MTSFNATTSQWNDPSRKALALSLRSEGFSFGRIAMELGTTRSAIAALCNRLGMVKNPMGSRIPLTVAQRNDKDRERHLANLAQRRRRSSEIRGGPTLSVYRHKPRSVALPEPPKNLSFDEMDFRTLCSYPTHQADHPATYCGHGKGLIGSYCEGHHRLTHA